MSHELLPSLVSLQTCGATQSPTGYKYTSMAKDLLSWAEALWSRGFLESEGFISPNDQRIIWAESIEKGDIDEPRVCHTETSKSEREKQILYINIYVWNLEKWVDDLICKAEIETQT